MTSSSSICPVGKKKEYNVKGEGGGHTLDTKTVSFPVTGDIVFRKEEVIEKGGGPSSTEEGKRAKTISLSNGGKKGACWGKGEG